MVKIVSPNVEIITPINGEDILKHIELCARNCYKSEDKITPDSARLMVRKLIESGHEAMLEHYSITVKLTTDVGAYKDLTRHRHASWAIESTRFCNYSKGKYGSELTFIKPCNIDENSELYNIWYNTMQQIESGYIAMAKLGAKADQLRMMLPHSTKADVIMTCNMREWRHIFKLRCDTHAHPSVQEIMKMVLNRFKKEIPVFFDDINFEETPNNIAAE